MEMIKKLTSKTSQNLKQKFTLSLICQLNAQRNMIRNLKQKNNLSPMCQPKDQRSLIQNQKKDKSEEE